MIFRVNRTSDWRELARPCDGAYREDGEWRIDISSLDALVEFSHNVGDIILTDDGKTIEIYDGYRE